MNQIGIPDGKSKFSFAPILIGFLAALVMGLLTGYGRLLVWFFLPGVQGGVFGAVLGYTLGNMLAGGKAGFPPRLTVIAGLAVVFYGSQALVPAFVLTGWDPLFLPGAILDGHFREVMTGASINSYTVRQGPLTPGWWLFFQGLDLIFFLISGLLCLGMGLDRKRRGFAKWKPLAVVAAICIVVLLSTGSAQSFHTGLLKDWHTRYGGGKSYMDWRSAWVETGLREDRVREFLESTGEADLRRMPQVGVLRALAHVRLGELAAADGELDRAVAAAKAFPGSIRVDMVRKVRASVFIRYVENMKKRVKESASRKDSSPALKRSVPEPGGLFPYEGMLKEKVNAH